MEESNQAEQKWMSENIWGWKWSFISLVVILIGFLFLIFVGPNQIEEAAEVEVDAIEQTESTTIEADQ